MIIAMIDGATRICGKTQGYIGLPVRDVVLTDTVNGPGTPAMQTSWTPTPDEIKRINAGANIIVTILGTTVQPIMLGVDEKVPSAD